MAQLTMGVPSSSSSWLHTYMAIVLGVAAAIILW